MKKDPRFVWGAWVSKDELKELLDSCKDLIANYGAHEGSCVATEDFGPCSLHVEAMEKRENRADLALQNFTKIFESPKLLQNQPDNDIIEDIGLAHETEDTSNRSE